MLDTTALSQAIETLAAETEANAISPAYLAAVLRKISDLISTAYSSAAQLADNAQTTADDAREDIRTLQGTTESLGKAIDTESEQRTGADENLTNSLTAAKKEILKRLQGTSDSSVGYTDPFIQGGSFTDESEMFAAIAANPLSGKEDSNYAKYTGNVRYDINGIIYDVHNYPINYATGQWLQAISGGLALQSNGTLVRDNDKYGIFYRFHDAEGNWTVWNKIEAVDTTARTSISTLAETLGAALYTGTLGGRNVTFYAGRKIVDLGSVAGSSVAENWAKQAEVASSDVRLIFYEDTTKNQSGIIMQVKTTTTGAVRQELFLGETHYIRNVFGTNTTTTTADSWKKTGVVSIAFTAASQLLAIKNNDDKQISAVTLPLANSSTAGLFSADDKTKIDAYPTYSSLLSKVSAMIANALSA